MRKLALELRGRVAAQHAFVDVGLEIIAPRIYENINFAIQKTKANGHGYGACEAQEPLGGARIYIALVASVEYTAKVALNSASSVSIFFSPRVFGAPARAGKIRVLALMRLLNSA